MLGPLACQLLLQSFLPDRSPVPSRSRPSSSSKKSRRREIATLSNSCASFITTGEMTVWLPARCGSLSVLLASVMSGADDRGVLRRVKPSAHDEGRSLWPCDGAFGGCRIGFDTLTEALVDFQGILSSMHGARGILGR